MLIPSLEGSFLAELTVRTQFLVSNYGPYSNGTNDDLPAFIACVTACAAAGGGEVVVDVPLWFLGSTPGSWNGLASGISNLVVRGHGDGSVIRVNCPTITPLSFANFNLLAFVDLVFLGTGSAFDCVQLFAGHSWQLLFERCSFINLRASAAVLSLFNFTPMLLNCKFGGCGSNSGPAVINCEPGGSVLLHNTHMIDYGYALGTVFNGRTNPIYPWVRFRGYGTGGIGTPVGDGVAVHAVDCFFDEGCLYAIDVGLLDTDHNRISNVVIENCSGDLSDTDGGAFSIAGVDSLKISGGDFGLGSITTAIKLRNVRYASVERFHINNGGTGAIDADSTVTYAEILECPNLVKSGSWAAGKTVMRFNGVDV
jgi:hypothetical protein